MPSQLDDDLQIFSLARTTLSSDLVALHKIQFTEFNHNMIIDKHPVLIVDTMSLCSDIIFGTDFLDKWGITLDYVNNQVQWMECSILP